MSSARTQGLDLDDDRPFQERYWRWQRGAWAVFALIVIAALAGLTGSGGPLSRASASGPGGEVDYPRVARWDASDDIRITLPASGARTAHVEIDRAFSDVFEVEVIQPVPAASAATAMGLRYRFDLGAANGPRRIVMHVRPLRPAMATPLRVRIDEAPPLRLTPIVLP